MRKVVDWFHVACFEGSRSCLMAPVLLGGFRVSGFVKAFILSASDLEGMDLAFRLESSCTPQYGCRIFSQVLVTFLQGFRGTSIKIGSRVLSTLSGSLKLL